MDFFQYQDQARRKTHILIGYYALAVALIIVAVYAVIIGVVYTFMMQSPKGAPATFMFWNPTVFIWVAATTTAIVVIGSLVKISQMSGGGEAVATMLGGRPVSTDTTDPDERKALNVVEEMAIASGTPVPRVFILDEESINAFAAGFTTRDAVVGITSGAIRHLKRDELQGVIAHEFSHIFNGDMRLNIRLIGILNGIVIIGLIGYWTMRIVSRSRGSGKGKGGILVIALAGLLIWLIGSIGVFFAKLIKSAISRQREYLADASAVQFTRNPEGIAGALKKIGGLTVGSVIQNNHAEEASHFFFSNCIGKSFFDLMSTHPPLIERIKRIDPSFGGDFEYVSSQQAAPAWVPKAVETEAVSGFQSAGKGRLKFKATASSVIQSAGTPTPEHVAYAASVIQSIPPDLAEVVRSPTASCALTYAMLISDKSDVQRRQIEHLQVNISAQDMSTFSSALTTLKTLRPELRMPLLTLAVSALKHLKPEQYRVFKETMKLLVDADQQTDLFEYALQRMVSRHLEPVFEETRRTTIHYYDIKPLTNRCAELLSCLAYWGADEVPAAQKAFQAGAAALGGGLQMKPLQGCGLSMLDAALSALAEASPAIKRTILSASIECVSMDGKVTREESELIRAIADALDCPLPPFLPGQAVPDAA